MLPREQRLAEVPRRAPDGRGLPPVDPAARARLLTGLLRGVSRAFYLTVRVLPARLREPVGLAYLLARAADTLADTRLLPPAERLAQLLAFRAQLVEPASTEALRAIEAALTAGRALAEEKELLQQLPQAFALLESLEPGDHERIRRVVVTLTEGMAFDLTAFPREDGGGLVALKTGAELDAYTYYVAGCVGEFWTRTLVAHEPALRGWDAEALSAAGVRFGKALQLTNVLRDLPRDLRIGRCYLPEEDLLTAGLEPGDLRHPDAGARARPILAKWLNTALAHYDAAEAYTLAIPRRCARLRLAVLWPILIGLGTLERLAREPRWLDPDVRVKVSRGFVYRTMLLSLPAAPSNALLGAWMRSMRRNVKRET
ncbi:MAG: squalene/phytoene synthase family protein [Planctomycetota bacterium]|nr:squalene/phytoene synthase family protein [Planctomycetota bacterium]